MVRCLLPSYTCSWGEWVLLAAGFGKNSFARQGLGPFSLEGWRKDALQLSTTPCVPAYHSLCKYVSLVENIYAIHSGKNN